MNPPPPRSRAGRRSAGALAVGLALLAWPAAACASTLIVPDDVPTVQAALDIEPDTVLVRSGVYPESPMLAMDRSSSGHIVVKGIGPTPPELGGFHIQIQYQQAEIIVEGFHFKDVVRLETWDETTEWFRFRGCVFDSGFAETWSDVHDVMGLEFSDCWIGVGLDAFAEHAHIFTNNTVVGSVRLRGSNLGVSIRDNAIFSGSPPQPWQGLSVEADALAGVIRGNRITGFWIGLSAPYGQGLEVSANRVEGAIYCGIQVTGDNVTVEGNEILRCGTGMILWGYGIVARDNVIGRSLGTGIEVQADYSEIAVHANTIYLSANSAINVTGGIGSPAIDISRNIAFGSGAYGMYGAPDGTTLSCNNWFGNAGGAVVPGGPDTTDLAVDPQFCGLVDDDVHLDAASPLLDATGCGLIGARGPGCGTTSVLPSASPRFQLGPISPQPALRDVEIRFLLPRAAAVELAILDLQGRLIARLADGPHAAGEHHVRWAPGDARAAAMPGMYFVRYRYPGGEKTRAVVRLR